MLARFAGEDGPWSSGGRSHGSSSSHIESITQLTSQTLNEPDLHLGVSNTLSRQLFGDASVPLSVQPAQLTTDQSVVDRGSSTSSDSSKRTSSTTGSWPANDLVLSASSPAPSAASTTDSRELSPIIHSEMLQLMLNWPSTSDLHCSFPILGCDETFHGSDILHWYTHSLSHFGSHHPPMETLCDFCDATVFKHDNPYTCWENRMLHVAHHYADGVSPDSRRPDFHLYKHLRETDNMSVPTYAMACRGTEYKLARPFAERSGPVVQRVEYVALQENRRKEDRIWRRNHKSPRGDDHRHKPDANGN